MDRLLIVLLALTALLLLGSRILNDPQPFEVGDGSQGMAAGAYISETSSTVRPPAALPEPTQTPTAVPPPEPTAEPVTGGNLDALTVPPTLTIRYDGCASTGRCYSYNFYESLDGVTEIVLANTRQPPSSAIHETCHSHQHWTINGGRSLAPADTDLNAWPDTGEGRSFTAAITGSPFPWGHISTRANTLEDMAETCTWWFLDPAFLKTVSPVRYEWARANLP